MMILVSAIMMAATAYAKNIETKPFEGVKVNVPARVRVLSGESYEMDVRSTDSIAASKILWSIDKGVLTIRLRDGLTEEEMSKLCITIVAPVEPKLTVGRDYEVRYVTRNRDMALSK